LLGWQYLAAHYLYDQTVAPFDPAIQVKLIPQLKTIISKNKNTVAKITTKLQSAGIKFIVLDKPDKCPIDGVSLRSGNNPAIALTLRHKRLDNFAFTLFHELGHVF
jgi:HTH-type transcriptional regulator/antitoxin HigA